MATITIGLSGSGVVNGTRTYTISDAHTTRWISAYRRVFNNLSLTDAQVLARWADEIILQTRSNVQQAELSQQTVIPIDIS